MGDNGNRMDIRPAQPGQKPPVHHELKIRRTMANGHVTVTGPLEDRGLCYLMMELARDIIQERAMKAKQEHPSQQKTPDDKPRPRRKFGE